LVILLLNVLNVLRSQVSSVCCPGKPESTLWNNIKGKHLTKTGNLDAQFWKYID